MLHQEPNLELQREINHLKPHQNIHQDQKKVLHKQSPENQQLFIMHQQQQHTKQQQTDHIEVSAQLINNPIQPKQSFKQLLAQRPINLPPIPQPTTTQPNKPSKTSINFYVSKTKPQSRTATKSTQKIKLSPSTNQPHLAETLINDELSMMKKSSLSEITVITLLYRVIQKMRQRGDDMTLECLLNQQKLVNISIAFLQKKHVTINQVQQLFSLQKQIIGFVQKINKVTMQNFKQQDQQVDIKLFSKAVDLLMIPYLHKYLKDLKTLGKLKVLTFNNLACIYKKKRKFGIALRSVSFALQIQQALLLQQASQQKYDIIPTYLNKAAILSEMSKHQKAILEIMKSQKFIQKIQKQVISQINAAQVNNQPQLQKRLQQKRYYGLYMKMIINYNMGAQKQHMKMLEQACEYYKQGRQLALLIGNQFMVKKFQAILGKLIEQRGK